MYYEIYHLISFCFHLFCEHMKLLRDYEGRRPHTEFRYSGIGVEVGNPFINFEYKDLVALVGMQGFPLTIIVDKSGIVR